MSYEEDYKIMQSLTEKSLNVPAFLSKLWKMVNDPKTDNLISWGLAGTTFVIQNRAQFWYDLLPVYYKHNNMSSFVRQLNMYGFHKISSIDTGTESDRDELQFFHPCFQIGKPELLKNIKRKVTSTHKPEPGTQKEQAINKEELTKFLADVTHLKGRQQSVDSQLLAMKQENAVLWRELALLRQKHFQQQKIVNKLIQFLVTLVQPPSRMTGLGSKRHYPLMINEKPPKKAKSTKSESGKSDASDGPIIHELDPDLLQEDLLNDAEVDPSDKEVFIQSPDFNRDIVVDLLSDSEMPEDITEEVPITLSPDQLVEVDGKIFLNTQSQDRLLSNLMNGNYNAKSVNDAMSAGTSTSVKQEDNVGSGSKTVATRDRVRLARLNSVTGGMHFSEDMDLHVENTQSELESLKDMLNPLLGGVQTVDANAFLGLFSDEAPPYGLSYTGDELPKSDPLMGSSQLTTYGSNLDFSQLFDEDSSDELRLNADLPITQETLDEGGSITTPQINPAEPNFPKAV